MYELCPQILNSALDLPSAEVYSCGLLKKSCVYWDLCGCAAADQALLRLDLPTEPHLKMLPDKAGKKRRGKR